ncbi:MAG: transcriptional repressor [Spirochaetales bacterium]|nr:transcriptional repressor [Spirochaetales bacterium]
MRKTQQRTAILEEIRKRKDHPTAYDIYHTVREFLPNISLGTVYRNLEMLSREGIIRSVDTGGEQKRFDADTTDHPHFRCLSCGRVDDLPPDLMKQTLNAAGKNLGDRVVCGVNLEYVGLCRECAARQRFLKERDN